jgi:preprotein translocase subunit SecB
MSETPGRDEGHNQGAAGGQAPVMRVLNQYVKDLSFENPNAPAAVRPDLPAPQVDVAVDVNARSLSPEQFEVELSCSATAKRDGQTVFVVETNYAGHFLIQNVPAEQIEAVLLVAAPQLLFPFARQVIATATRDGGFMPLMLEPLDFAGMYQMQKARAKAGANAAEGDGPPEIGTA